MEFGGFDDDLFTENEKKPKIATPVNYKPKTLTPQWYMYTEEQAVPEEDPDKVYFYIYRGNHHYYKGEWSCALEAYTRVMALIPGTNTSMRRLLLESIARCRWRCGEANLAVEIGEKLVEESTNDHQQFTAHSALAMFNEAAGNTEGQAHSLKSCLDIRPLSAQHWIQLAKIYLKKSPSKDCKKMPTAAENDLEVKRHKGHLNDKESTGSSMNHWTIQRTNEDFSASVESKPSATKDAASHNGNLGRKGLDEPSGVNSEGRICKAEGILNDLQDDQIQDGVRRNLLPHDGNINGEACESRHSNRKSSTGKEESIILEPSPTASENALRQPFSSAVGHDGGEVDNKLARLSVSDEGIAVAKENGLEEGISGGGYRYREGDLEMEAIICLLKARVILRSLQICAVSLTKIRNAELIAEIDGLLSTLHLDPAFVQEMSTKMYNEVFEKEIKKGTVLS